MGLLDFLMNGNPNYQAQGGVATDPIMNVAMGLLANSGPSLSPVNPWAGGMQGLFQAQQNKQQFEAQQRQKQLQDMQIQQLQNRQKVASNVQARIDYPYVMAAGPIDASTQGVSDILGGSGDPEWMLKGLAMKAAKSPLTILPKGATALDASNNVVARGMTDADKTPNDVTTFKLLYPNIDIGTPEGADLFNKWAANHKTSEAKPFFQFMGGTDANGNPSILVGDARTGRLSTATLPGGAQPIKSTDSPLLQGEIAYAKKREGALGGSLGIADANLQEDLAVLPQLMDTVNKLSNLGKTATYTAAGQVLDTARTQLGLDPRQAAIDRSEYMARVDNQILPLLRRTFGAQFTEREGNSLKATLGAPNATPAQKDSVLRAFILTKMQGIESLKRQVGDDSPAIPIPSLPGASPPSGAKQAPDGKYYVPDPSRPGKYLQWQP